MKNPVKIQHKYTFIILIGLLMPFFSVAQNKSNSFRVVPLGVLGGIDESNLSAYMLAAKGSNNYICLDAGTLHYGLQKAVDNKVFSLPAEKVLKQYIKGYFISHAHLDHIAGLIINAPDDSTKNIYGLQSTLETIKTHYFTWASWANFANQGEAPALKKYHYTALVPGNETAIENTDLKVQVFPLSHSNLTSTAFLVRSNNAYILYLGDTGADEIEKSSNFQNMWQAVAPLVKSKQLKAIMIEVSFPDEQPDKTLFGHLTPHWLMVELDKLAALTGVDAIKGLNVVVTHLKPPAVSISKIKTQLKVANKLQLNLIYPQQGKALNF
ncbi:3',5'-cyclic-nucleotide phosphodiesterase [Mucilaginibacter pineti]|uniref:3',5'-cyclic-nucleotide phosphodiesterase n=1 Tax=Mucilaginibacter pineti TaxID=1391627 RepID=A0A1G7BQH6_9SPHI|nr:3',5'-cyclic-nucleotide phosphodiesterase [Mucilaginibacter pineti]SDE29233.1 3',5'-cyclic-nucleotide phosphodiesterase [Mucilaginibacter pineti]